eukprot:s8633_g3.t1
MWIDRSQDHAAGSSTVMAGENLQERVEMKSGSEGAVEQAAASGSVAFSGAGQDFGKVAGQNDSPTSNRYPTQRNERVGTAAQRELDRTADQGPTRRDTVLVSIVKSRYAQASRSGGALGTACL